MQIYVYGCMTCGRVGKQIRRVTEYCIDNSIPLEIIDSKLDELDRTVHRSILAENNLPADSYTAIVKEDTKVTRLHSWNL